MLERLPPRTAKPRLLARVAERFGLTARGYHRVLRVARTIADLDDRRVAAPYRRSGQLPPVRIDEPPPPSLWAGTPQPDCGQIRRHRQAPPYL